MNKTLRTFRILAYLLLLVRPFCPPANFDMAEDFYGPAFELSVQIAAEEEERKKILLDRRVR